MKNIYLKYLLILFAVVSAIILDSRHYRNGSPISMIDWTMYSIILYTARHHDRKAYKVVAAIFVFGYFYGIYSRLM